MKTGDIVEAWNDGVYRRCHLMQETRATRKCSRGFYVQWVELPAVPDWMPRPSIGGWIPEHCLRPAARIPCEQRENGPGHHHMTRSQLYRKLRRERGTQEAVAALLGVHPMTISRRERGEMEIPDEALIALKSLPKLPKKP